MAKKGPRQITQKNLSPKQKEKLAEFCGNLAVTWLAAGIIPSFIAGKITIELFKPAVISLVPAGVLLTIMLSLVKGEK